MSMKTDENGVSLLFGLQCLPTTFALQRYQAPPTSPQSMANPSPRHGLALGVLGRHERNICQLGKFQTFRDSGIQNDHNCIPSLLKVKDLVVFNTKETRDTVQVVPKRAPRPAQDKTVHRFEPQRNVVELKFAKGVSIVGTNSSAGLVR